MTRHDEKIRLLHMLDHAQEAIAINNRYQANYPLI